MRSTSRIGRWYHRPIGRHIHLRRTQFFSLYLKYVLQTWKLLERWTFYDLLLFNYNLMTLHNISHYIMSNGTLVGVLNWRLCKEAVLAYFTAKYRHLYGGSEDNHENPTEIQTGHLPNTRVKLYCLSQSARSDSVTTIQGGKLIRILIHHVHRR